MINSQSDPGSSGKRPLNGSSSSSGHSTAFFAGVGFTDWMPFGRPANSVEPLKVLPLRRISVTKMSSRV